MSTVTQSGKEFFPVKGAGPRRPYGTALLKFTRDGDRLRVSPTTFGRSKLPRFWTVWLEDLVLKKTRPNQQFHVSISKQHVFIGANGKITIEGLYATVQQLVAQIRSVEILSLFPQEEHPRRGGTAYRFQWRIRRPITHLKVEQMQALLPKGARLSVVYVDTLQLKYSGDLPLVQHVKLQVEYFAFVTSSPHEVS